MMSLTSEGQVAHPAIDSGVLRALNQRVILSFLLAACVIGLFSFPAEGADEKRRSRRDRKSRTAQQDQGPQDYRSRNFLIHTDLPKEEAEELLERMETMLKLISKYWGARCRKVIECYVVKDLSKWPPNSINPEGLAHIRAGGGVTLSRSKSFGSRDNIVDADAVVFAVTERGTPLHEAVHAYCSLTFGRTGPTWYSEGMAELGAYWRNNDHSVKLHPVVLQYLQGAELKSLNEIVNGRQATGDSWQEYAWRWALCHLLAYNPNYQDRFRPLGLALLKNQDVSFEQVYGSMAQEIMFEYQFFIEHLEQGVRADLISFDWNRKFRNSRGKSPVRATISADHGWQPSGLYVDADQKYVYSAEGQVQLAKDGAILDGNGIAVAAPPEGGETERLTASVTPPAAERSTDQETVQPGQLIGVVLTYDETKGYALSKQFLLGRYGEFTAPATGKLFLRCEDKWGELADNEGELTVNVRASDAGGPLKEPPPETLKPRDLRQRKLRSKLGSKKRDD